MKKKEINVGIIGIGNWGKNLVRIFDKNSKIIICANKKNIKDHHFIKKNYPKIKLTTNYKDILNNPLIEVVVIATPIKTHFEITKDSLLKGKKIFLEKPLANNTSDAKKLIKMSKKKLLFIGNIFLYHPCYKKVKELIAKDKITYLEMNWNKFGTFNEDIFLNLVSQEFSIVYGLLGKFPKEIRLTKSEAIISKSDMISLNLKFRGEINCKININRIHPYKHKEIKIITKKRKIYYWINNEIILLDKKNNNFKTIFKSEEEPLTREIKDFLKYAKNGSEPTLNKTISLKVIEMIEKITK